MNVILERQLVVRESANLAEQRKLISCLIVLTICCGISLEGAADDV